METQTPRSDLSEDANNIIEHLLKYETEKILYAKEIFSYDGFDEFGPECVIAYLRIIILKDLVFDHETSQLIPKYEYKAYHKEWTIDTEPIPIYHMTESTIYDKIDIELFDV